MILVSQTVTYRGSMPCRGPPVTFKLRNNRVLCSRSLKLPHGSVAWGVHHEGPGAPIHSIENIPDPVCLHCRSYAPGPPNYRQELPKTRNLRYRFCTAIIKKRLLRTRIFSLVICSKLLLRRANTATGRASTDRRTYQNPYSDNRSS